ncbi:ABC oligopeptide transporter, fused ATPase subunits [Parvularcula bermudensis HTCC2503]|uniref:ABC oligopeptide transporter, fused ATPase subunits n=1 Tax=Parvularcula bermudensis (strain ATCC BAA-594 / HTCC2503 / KCTC 12087) TaxID=314260 RepID=E0TFC9_PARBH|nr:ABC transporter ATP-binding protein [Parvularcula bermudensis]ADM09530.1 ABC oligopeptide transporter, fused ATPase subunits [Parvularcula bermudensis HTCC2503]
MSSTSSPSPLLDIQNLTVDFDTPDGTVHAVKSVSLSVAPGEVVAIVGESGSGKSQIAMTTLGLLASNGTASGHILFHDQDLLSLSKKKMNDIRGVKISMIFQEPMTSLDPLYSIGDQIIEPLMVHKRIVRREAQAKALDLLRLVQIPDPERRMKSYPTELSGGQRQRVMIAMALANAPDMLIADEPTTALDVTTQAEILKLLASLNRELGMSIIFITHDLGIVEAFADRVFVMRQGQLLEEGKTVDVFESPKTDYTRTLLAAEPDGTKRPVDDSVEVVLEAKGVHVSYGDSPGLFRKDTRFHAVRGVDLRLREGQTVGLVGESGSGKSTLGRALLRLTNCEGQITYLGRDLLAISPQEMKPLRRELQMVFQDPYGSLSPRMTVLDIVEEGLRTHAGHLSKADRDAQALDALEKVGLDANVRNRFPHEFSGGQRQRIAIARAMVLKPKIVVLDEPTSALDRTVQKEMIELLRTIQSEFLLSYIFISHDLAVVKAMADYVMVMRDGEIVEEGMTQQIFEDPHHEYTKSLIASSFTLKDMLTNPA